MAFVSLNSPSCEVPCLILSLVVYQDVTRQAKGLYRLKHVVAVKSGLAYLSRRNSSWFCHRIRWCLRAGELEQGLGKLARGLVETMGGRQWLPTVASGSPEWRSGAAVVIGLGCARQGEKEVQMSLVLSTGTAGHKREGREVDTGTEHGGDEVAAGGGSGGRGAREIGQQGRARAAADVLVTCGEGGSRRWSSSGLDSGGGEALCTGGSEEQGSRGVPEEEERMEGSEGLMCKTKKNLGTSR
jgi:hypothetical protein